MEKIGRKITAPLGTGPAQSPGDPSSKKPPKYKQRSITLEPAADETVLAEKSRRGNIHYSKAINSIVLAHGTMTGMAATRVKLNLASILSRLERMLGRMQLGSSVSMEEVRQVQSLAIEAAAALG